MYAEHVEHVLNGKNAPHAENIAHAEHGKQIGQFLVTYILYFPNVEHVIVQPNDQLEITDRVQLFVFIFAVLKNASPSRVLWPASSAGRV